jgi:predicted dehydrogenase
MSPPKEPKDLRIGVIGAGVFGSFHAAKIAAAPGVVLSGIYDPDEARAAGNALKHAAQAFSALDQLFALSDAVIIASPAETHGAMVSAALAAGKHVYVEKPLADSGAMARSLATDATMRGLILQVGHQERFVFEAIGLLDVEERPIEIDAIREGPSSGRGLDTSVTMDLMIHDLDLVLRLFRAKAFRVSAVRLEGEPGLANAIDALVEFEGGGRAMLLASRIAPERRRSMRLTYPSGTVEIDFVARTFSNEAGLPLNHDFSDRLPDPLGAAVNNFISACRGEAVCAVPAIEAAEAVYLAESIDAAAG